MKTVLCENTEWLLSEEAFSIYASCMYHPTYEEYKAQMEDYLHDSSVKVFVCENRGKRIGMMVLKSSGVAAEIIGIAVSDNARHKGIGKELIQSVIKSEEIERIKAQTDDGSIGFYRKCGFSEEKTVVEYSDGSAVRYNCVLYKQTTSSLQVRKMKYRLPEINDKDILQKYVQEHHNNGETSISASLGLSSSDYTEWVTKIKNNALSGDEQWGKSLLYLCFDGDRLIGLLSVRYELPEVLSEKYGDIGYGVRPSERNKGYATAMLKYALSVCKEKGMEKVILGCYKENLASAATIQKNGGTLIAENENYKEGRTKGPRICPDV